MSMVLASSFFTSQATTQPAQNPLTQTVSPQGVSMKFPENNKILYGQDFSVYESIPSGVDFTIEPLGKDKVMLIAPNYGGKPYGNGRLYLSCGFAFSGLTKRAADKWRAVLFPKLCNSATCG